MRRSASSSRAWQKRDSCTPRSYKRERLLERQVAFLELLHDRFELGDRAFEVLDRGVGHHKVSHSRSGLRCARPTHVALQFAPGERDAHPIARRDTSTRPG